MLPLDIIVFQWLTRGQGACPLINPLYMRPARPILAAVPAAASDCGCVVARRTDPRRRGFLLDDRLNSDGSSRKLHGLSALPNLHRLFGLWTPAADVQGVLRSATIP